MKISRHGAYANHGMSTVDLKKITASWDAKENSIVIKSNAAKDFNTESTHNYKIIVPLSDLAKIFRALGSTGVQLSSEEIEAGLEDETKSIYRVLSAASGLASIKGNNEDL